MRSLSLSKSGTNKVRSHQFELKAGDFEDSIKPIPPGEWCFIKLSATETLVGFLNPLIEDKYTCAYLLSSLKPEEIKTFTVEDFLRSKIKAAYSRRRRFSDYSKNARMIYGASDGLPGLIVDQFENAAIVQINTAGLDRYRELIQAEVSKESGTEAYFLDNHKYREKEFLPTFESKPFPEILVSENNLKYKIRPEVLQKVGFYYDHRENRLNLMQMISRLSNKPKSGVDLFSYAGAWGMSALKSGVEHVTFVDQGDFGNEVEESMKLNGFSGRGTFQRADVFKFLDESIQKKSTFDLILCDPPAFAKSLLQKPQALDGYSKLHRKVLKLCSSGSLVAFSSCTHYVSHAEFQKNVLEAANKENRKIQLVYSGMQGFDHPVTSLEDRSNYIKSYFYIVE